MRRLRVVAVLPLVLLCLVQAPSAQGSVKKLAQTGLQFLKVDVGARPAAMGGAFVVVGEGASAMFYNPAGIALFQDNIDLFVSRTQWFANIAYNAGGVVKNLGKYGNVGISFILCDYGDDFIGTRVADNEQGYIETGSLQVGAYAVGVSYARSLTDKFSVGGQIKFTGQHLGSSLMPGEATVENRVSGLAYDFGTVFYPGFKSFRFGMSVRNFSAQFKYADEPFQLPLTFKIGIAMDVRDLFGEHDNPLLIAVDAIHPRDYTERIHLGGEYWYRQLIALRMGYKFNYDEEGLTVGVGLRTKAIRLDYSFSDMADFGAVSRFSVGVAF